jgi:multiple sugar transport system permease protein
MKKQAHIWIFLSPALLLFATILVFPVLYSVYLSLFDTTVATLVQGGDKFIGVDNYFELFKDTSFQNSVGLLALFIVTTTFLEVSIALAVALYLDQVLRIPKLLQTLLLLPMFVLPVVSGLTFRYIFDPNEGVLGAVYGWFGAAPPGVLGDPWLAFGAVVVQDVWRMWPFLFLVIFAGMTSLPQEPIEAVQLDGATTWQAFRYVMLPMLRGTIVVAILLKVVESLKAFTEIYVMTGGGPGESTSILSMFIVKQAFTFLKIGYGASASTLLLFVGTTLAVLSLLAQSWRKRSVV